ncbi:MAG: DUF2079 domain-containing protein [Chloroflexi bacterium]|nr:DUF2079 domain-containing protein [Chloroflexota bacterium]
MIDVADFAATLVLALVAAAAAFFAVRSGRVNPARWGAFWSRRADLIFGLLVAGYVVLFAGLAVLRYLTFHTGYLQESTSWDLGQYSQLIWNSLNGRLLQGTYVTDADSFLGKSFSPILLALVPLYALWSSPMVLLVVQTVGLGLGALPVYWFARQSVGRPLALVVGLMYLLSPAVENIGLTEFHEIAFATPLLAFATYLLLRRHTAGFLVCLGLALMVKEEIALIAVIFGLFILVVQRRPRLGIGLAVFGTVFAYLLLQTIIPYFRGNGYGSAFYYFGQGEIGGGGTRYGYLGHSLPEIAETIVTRPALVWQMVVIPDKIEYVLQLLVPFAFVPLLGIEVFALALPTLGYSLLSTYGLQYSIRSYYFAPMLPFFFFAAVVGIGRVLRWAGRRSAPAAWRAAAAALLLAAAGASYVLQAPGPLARYFQPERYDLDAHALLGNELASRVPQNAFVVAQNEMLARLSDRRSVYEIPIPDYRQVDYLFADQTRGWYGVHRGIWDYVLSTGYFQVVAAQDGYIVAKRRPPENSTDIRFGNHMTLDGYSIVLTDTVRGGTTFRPIVEWHAEKPIADRYAVTVSVVDPQGDVWATEDREPDDGKVPTDQWMTGQPVGDQYSLKLPPTMPPGDYQVKIAVHVPGTSKYLDSFDVTGRSLGTQPTLASVTVAKDKESITASELVKLQPMNEYLVDMGELRFIGCYPPPKSVAAGQRLSVGIYWRARDKPAGDYAVAVQLRDSAGEVVFEQDGRPANGAYPTLQWDPGEVLLDWHDFVVPTDLAPGEYGIFAQLRQIGTGRVLGETKVAPIQIDGK